MTSEIGLGREARDDADSCQNGTNSAPLRPVKGAFLSLCIPISCRYVNGKKYWKTTAKRGQTTPNGGRTAMPASSAVLQRLRLAFALQVSTIRALSESIYQSGVQKTTQD